MPGIPRAGEFVPCERVIGGHMRRRSITAGVRRVIASSRSYCACVALVLSSFFLPALAMAQSPALRPATPAEAPAGKIKHPKPAIPPQSSTNTTTTDAEPVDLAAKPPALPAAQKPSPAAAPKESEELSVAL